MVASLVEEDAAMVIEDEEVRRKGGERPPYWLTLLLIHILVTCSLVLSNEEDSVKLLKFKASLLNTERLSNWNPTSEPCNWTGVICDEDGSVFGLQLENMGLGGTIDTDTLAEITSIRMLSFMNNSFEGSMPNLHKIGHLRGIFLSYNKFSGVINGDVFLGMSSLRKVELGDNNFTGTIPITLTQLPVLVDLQLQNNNFAGHIPEFELQYLILKVNFANNKLEGHIPAGLSNQDPNSFAGNNLCDAPLKPCKISKKRNTLKIMFEQSGIHNIRT